MKKITLILALLFLVPVVKAQSSCATALSVTAGTITVPVIDGINTPTSCSSATLANWYSYTPTQNYTVTITSDLDVNICKDTHFSVFTGSCGSLVCLTSDDDSGVIICSTSNGQSYLSKKTFDVTSGSTYLIAWDNRWMTTGFDFQIIESPILPSPCATATPITSGVVVVDAIDGPNAVTGCSTAPLAEWFSYTPSSNYQVTITSDLQANICKNTNFSVYTGSCAGALTCVTSDDDSGILQCNSGNTFSLLSKKTFNATMGVTYYIAWDNKWSTQGFVFEVIETPIVVPIYYNPQPVALSTSYKMCIVDMNGDYKDDVVGVGSGTLQVLYQGNAGTLTPTSYSIPGGGQMPSWSMAAGDMNKDGYNDLLLGSGSGLTFWKSDGTGTGYTSDTPGQYIFCQRTNFADLNSDGHLDAFSCHDIAPNCYYLNDGANNFTFYQTGVTPGAMSLGSIGGNYATIFTDYDNDGDVDMFVSKCSGPPCELHRNNGDGTYTDVSALAQINFTPVSSWSSAVADFDNDGDMDILVGANGGAATRLYQNNVDTTNETEEAFTNITLGSGFDATVGTARDWIAYDFDNDGFVDIMGPGGKIMFNQGDGSFSPTTYTGLNIGAVGDVNGDGFLDFLNGTTIRYAIPNGNNWVKISLQGIQSNSNGIGARIEAYGPWGKQIRDVRSGEGFGYMSSLNTIFGIGNATTIEKIIIRWPSGIVDTIMNPSINENITVVEDSTTLNTNQVTVAAFSIYPNPANDVLNIQLSDTTAAIKNAEVYDLAGRLVLSPDMTNHTVSVKSLSTGTYILLLKDVSGKMHTQKFIKN